MECVGQAEHCVDRFATRVSGVLCPRANVIACKTTSLRVVGRTLEIIGGQPHRELRRASIIEVLSYGRRDRSRGALHALGHEVYAAVRLCVVDADVRCKTSRRRR